MTAKIDHKRLPHQGGRFSFALQSLRNHDTIEALQAFEERESEYEL
jgi:hypothetical protein